MSEYVQVEQDSSLYKNTETGAVINVNDQKLHKLYEDEAKEK